MAPFPWWKSESVLTKISRDRTWNNCLWLVVSKPLKKNISMEGLSHILWKIKNVPNHQPGLVHESFTWSLLIYHPIPNLLSQGRGSNWSAHQMCSLLNFCVTLQSAGSQLLVQNHIFLRSNFQKKTRMCFKTSSVMINEKIGMEERPCPSGRKCAWNHKLLTWAKWCGRGMRTWHFRGAWGKTNLVIPGSSLALIKQIPRTI